MATGNPLTVDGELQYIVQWFTEWSELQRDDFLPILVEFLSVGTSATLNGITSSLTGANLTDKPMSLFQCRIKLFREWSAKWPAEQRLKLQDKVQLIDAAYGNRVLNEIHGGANKGAEGVNGFASIGSPSSGTDPTTEQHIQPIIIPVQNEQVLV